jgi:hypothetical protein
LVLPSNFKFILPRYAEIRLADNANCPMLKNRMMTDQAERLPADCSPLCRHLWWHVNEFSDTIMSENIEIQGGIWNFNNLNQLPNPEQSKIFEPYGYTGDGMLFYGVKNLKLSSMTFKDPVHYGATFDRVSYFTVEDITFDYNLGNPRAINMDGVHLDGNCHYGVIRNLKGTCYDDLVALNAHEGSHGPITNIEINGIYAEECHSAVRLLLVAEEMSNIHISNVYGTYYQYCIGVTKFYPGDNTGKYDALTFDNIYASKAMPVRKGDFQWPPKTEDCYPLIYVQENTVVNNLTIRALHRREEKLPRATIYVGKNALVNRLILEDITTTNTTGLPMPLLDNHGTIRYLSVKDIDSDQDPALVNSGIIEVTRP